MGGQLHAVHATIDWENGSGDEASVLGTDEEANGPRDVFGIARSPQRIRAACPRQLAVHHLPGHPGAKVDVGCHQTRSVREKRRYFSSQHLAIATCKRRALMKGSKANIWRVLPIISEPASRSIVVIEHNSTGHQTLERASNQAQSSSLVGVTQRHARQIDVSNQLLNTPWYAYNLCFLSHPIRLISCPRLATGQ